MARRPKTPIKPLLGDETIARMTAAEREAEIYDRLACLGSKEKAFILRHLNPADERSIRETAIDAGFEPSKANDAARKLLSRQDIVMIVALSLSLRQDRFDATAERVIEQLAAIAMADISDLIVPEIDPETDAPTGNTLLALHRASEAQMAALAAAEIVMDGNRDLLAAHA